MAQPSFLNVGAATASSGATSRSPALPTGLINGNILIARCVSFNNATHSISGTGWQALGTQTNSGASYRVSRWWRVVDGTEGAPTISWTGSVGCRAIITQYSRDNCDTTSPWGTIGTANTGSGSTHSSTGFNTTGDDSLMLYFDDSAANSACAQPSGWTENVDSGNAIGDRSVTGSKAMGASGSASGNISVTGATAQWVQQQVEMLAPALASGKMCAGLDSVYGVQGYMSAGYAATFAIPSGFGTIGGESTSFGVVEGLYSFGGGAGVTLSSPSGTPTSITIDGTPYTLSFDSDDGTYYLYNIVGFAGFTNTVTYDWTFSTGFSLDSAPGSYSLNGAAAGFLLSRIFPSAAGAFSLNGAAVGLLKGWAPTFDAGAFTLNGAAVGLGKGVSLSADVGAFTLSGAAVSFPWTHQLSALAGSYALTGAAAGLYKGFAASAATGAFALTGADLGFLNSRNLAAAAAAYSLIGAAVSLSKGFSFSFDAGEFTLSGAALGFRYFSIEAGSGTYLLTYTDAELSPWYRNYRFFGETDRKAFSTGARMAFQGRRR